MARLTRSVDAVRIKHQSHQACKADFRAVVFAAITGPISKKKEPRGSSFRNLPAGLGRLAHWDGRYGTQNSSSTVNCGIAQTRQIARHRHPQPVKQGV